jgi:hypothetical protein
MSSVAVCVSLITLINSVVVGVSVTTQLARTVVERSVIPPANMFTVPSVVGIYERNNTGHSIKDVPGPRLVACNHVETNNNEIGGSEGSNCGPPELGALAGGGCAGRVIEYWGAGEVPMLLFAQRHAYASEPADTVLCLE